MKELERKLLNLFMVNQFSCLTHMYKQAETEARRERELQLFNDWKEWSELDPESKQFVRNYLSKND